MTTGVVTSVSPHNGSGTLTTAVLSSATVLPLHDAEPFAEDFSEPRFLVIGNEATPREYVAVQKDEDDPAGESVTLADPVGGAGFEADLPVTPWDPTVTSDDKRAVTHQVWVRLDGQDGAIRATVPHEWIPLSGVDALDGARVGLTEDPMSGWLIEQVFGRMATIDSSYVSVPFIQLALDSPQTIPDTTWTTLDDWNILGATPASIAVYPFGSFYLLAEGLWQLVVTVRWESDPAGGRQIQLATIGPPPFYIDTIITETVAAPASTGASQHQLTGFIRVPHGGTANFKVMVRQSSGGSLDILASDDTTTHVEIVRLG